MRISEVINMGWEYLVLGLICVAILAAVFAVGYFIVYKKLMGGTRKPSKRALALWGLFLCYMAVVLGVTLLRPGMFLNTRSQGLFSSYRQAWVRADAGEWRNIILNICMFVPFGIFLPLLSKRMRVFWKTYAAGLLMTLFIENVQLVAKLGIFELDDIFNNALGAMIGYGLVMAALHIFESRKQRQKGTIPRVLALQMPLLAAVIFFASAFIIYQRQELGNLASAYVKRQDMERFVIFSEKEFSEDAGNAYIYATNKGSSAEALKLAEDIFKRLGTSIDEQETQVYDESSVFRSAGGDYILWINHVGMTTDLWITGAQMDEEDAAAAERKEQPALYTEKEIRGKLAAYQVEIPEQAQFEADEEMYIFSMDMQEADGQYYDGRVTCRLNAAGELEDIQNGLVRCEEYKQVNIISEQEAYERLLEGKFLFYPDDFGEQIEMLIQGIQLTYEIDTKGFYQPVYKFDVRYEGEDEDKITISALSQ